ncbi:hypothetical protein OHAE_4200 [Ochrobactrum soli]|uniref:Uncharacterized protein n=1 Tax=Ochrobactrum soli TaxID=2448455 RepID=A0A2P9HBD4_9HYPH|nr:hypothetical protein OHAE_4200 [[Ochrobactrum] soli]
MGRIQGRVIDETVDAAEPFENLSGDSLGVFWPGDVQG